MVYWALLLHLYQPPTQLYGVLKKVCNESYRPLVRLFRELPHARATVNINGTLTEMLDEHGMSDVVEGLRERSEQGQLEFTGSGKYHPILPLIPQNEMKRQIVHNFQTNRRFFGELYSPQGFFPPELAYSRDIVKPILDTGHNWMILSGVACPETFTRDTIYYIASAGQRLDVFFRDDILSNQISFEQTDAKGFVQSLKELHKEKNNTYVITAMDAETFGHHIAHWEELFLAEVYEILKSGAKPPPMKPLTQAQSTGLVKEHGSLLSTPEVIETKEIEVVTISQLLELFPLDKPIEPYPSSWSTSRDDIQAGNYYPLWKGKGNHIHQLQWRHLKIAFDLAKKALKVINTESGKYYADIARGLLDRALHSDQFWWANPKARLDINMVNRGLLQQDEVIFNAYKAITISNLSEEEKAECWYRVIASRDIRGKIIDLLLATV